MILQFSQIDEFITSFLLPFCRVGAFTMTVPFFNEVSIPKKIRIIFAVFLTLVLSQVITVPKLPDLISLEGAIICSKEILIGLIFGFIFQMIMHIFIFSAQFISTQIGLSFASLVNPTYGNVPFLAQFYSMLTIMIFLSLNGHLVLIHLLSDSFVLLPLNNFILSQRPLEFILHIFSWTLQSAVVFCLPIIIAILLVNFLLAILTRASPQINIFSLAFPISILVGFFILYLSLINYLPSFDSFFDFGLLAFKEVSELSHV